MRNPKTIEELFNQAGLLSEFEEARRLFQAKTGFDVGGEFHRLEVTSEVIETHKRISSPEQHQLFLESLEYDEQGRAFSLFLKIQSN
jgi:hypothetical protein